MTLTILCLLSVILKPIDTSSHIYEKIRLCSNQFVGAIYHTLNDRPHGFNVFDKDFKIDSYCFFL